MAIKLTKQSSGSVVTPLTGKVQIFVDSADGSLKIKDDTNTVTPVGGSGGGLTQDPVVKTANFTAAVGTSYLISSGTPGSLVATLPSAVHGDEIEFRGTGAGGDAYLSVLSNTTVSGPGGLNIGFTPNYFTYSIPGLHVVYRYVTDRWCVVSDSVSTFFANVDSTPSASSMLNSVLYTDSSLGQAYATQMGNNTFLGRHDADLAGIQPLSIPVFTGLRKTLTASITPLSGSLTDITDLTFTPDYQGWSTFEFYVPLKIAAGTGDFTLAVNYTDTSTEFTVGGTIASSSTVATYVHTGTVGAGLTGATQGVGTFVARLTGSILTTGPGNLVLRASCTNTTDSSILAGAWGVVSRANMFP